MSPSRHPHLWRQAFRANLTGRQGRAGALALPGWLGRGGPRLAALNAGVLGRVRASVFSVGLIAGFGLQVASAARTTTRRGVIANAIAVLANAVITYKVIHSGVRDAPCAKRSDR